MKKWIVSLTIILGLATFLLFVVPLPETAYAIPRDWVRSRLGAFTGPSAGTEQDDNAKASLDLTHAKIAAQYGCSGDVFFVDSAVAGTEGTSWATAVATIDAAVNLCAASNSDLILVAAGHAETFTAQALDLDVIGITVIGLGNGSLRPTITYNHANAEVAIGADNVRVENIVFFSSITDVLMGIEVEDGVDYFLLEDCSFLVDSAGTDDFVEAVNFVNNNTGCTIRNCVFNAGAGGAAHAIFMDADTDSLTIEYCDIRGDYSVACIGGDTTASTDILIRGNILINGDLVGDDGINTVEAIVLLDATAGLICNNIFVSDKLTGVAMRTADDCVFVNNYLSDRDGDEFSGVTEDTSATIAAFVDGG